MNKKFLGLLVWSLSLISHAAHFYVVNESYDDATKISCPKTKDELKNFRLRITADTFEITTPKLMLSYLNARQSLIEKITIPKLHTQSMSATIYGHKKPMRIFTMFITADKLSTPISAQRYATYKRFIVDRNINPHDVLEVSIQSLWWDNDKLHVSFSAKVDKNDGLGLTPVSVLELAL